MARIKFGGLKKGVCRVCGKKINRQEIRCRDCYQASLTKMLVENLTLENFNQHTPNGRCFTAAWNGKKFTRVHRARWVWEQANGKLPWGSIIHHVNHDPSDDRLENLMAVTRVEHNKIHLNGRYGKDARNWKGGKTFGICEHCGMEFEAYDHLGDKQRFCSIACKGAAVTAARTNVLVCEQCGKEFARTTGKIELGQKNGSRRSFCSRACWREMKKQASLVILRCDCCGKTFERWRSTTGKSRSGMSFCSQACSNRRHHSTISQLTETSPS